MNNFLDGIVRPNDTIQKIVHRNLEKLGGIKYSDDEKEYAQEIYQTLINPDLKIGSQQNVLPFKYSHSYGSTDVGDVSWVVPTAVGTTQLTSPTSVEP